MDMTWMHVWRTKLVSPKTPMLSANQSLTTWLTSKLYRLKNPNPNLSSASVLILFPLIHPSEHSPTFHCNAHAPGEGLHTLVVAQDLRGGRSRHRSHQQRVSQSVLRQLRLQSGPVVPVAWLHAPKVELEEAFRRRGSRVRLVRAQLACQLVMVLVYR